MGLRHPSGAANPRPDHAGPVAGYWTLARFALNMATGAAPFPARRPFVTAECDQ
jgi:hypothetical protein